MEKIAMLSNISTLRGHKGCVNRLAWSNDGNKLASVSDDTDVIIWGFRGSGDYYGAPPPATARATEQNANTGWGMRLLTRIDTGHSANVFGVKFLPCTNERVLVTGGMDGEVRMHALDHGSVGRARARSSASGSGGLAGTSPALSAASPGLGPVSPGLGALGSPALTRSPRIARLEARFGARLPTSEHWYSELRYSHRSRVKAVDVAPDCAHLFWSAAEDSTVCQFDVREPVGKDRPVIITLAHAAGGASVSRSGVGRGQPARRRAISMKHIAINPVRPHLLAVACGDAYLRVFDRRMLPALGQVMGNSGLDGFLPSAWSHGSARAAHANVLTFAPLHLAPEYQSPWLLPPSQLSRAPSISLATRSTSGGSYGDVHATHCDWDETGRLLLGTWHGDGVYVFDVSGGEAVVSDSVIGPVEDLNGPYGYGYGVGCEHAPYGANAHGRRATFRPTTTTASTSFMASGSGAGSGADDDVYDVAGGSTYTGGHGQRLGLISASVGGSQSGAGLSSGTRRPSAGEGRSPAPSGRPSVLADNGVPTAPAVVHQAASLPVGSLRARYPESACPTADLAPGPWHLKEAGNTSFRQGDYTEAIAHYSSAIELACTDLSLQTRGVEADGRCGSGGLATGTRLEGRRGRPGPQPVASPAAAYSPQGTQASTTNHTGLALLRANRAMAYMRRGGTGDSADAVMDCAASIALAPHSWKAQLRLVQALREAKHYRTALAHAKAFVHNWAAPSNGILARTTAAMTTAAAQGQSHSSAAFVAELDRAITSAQDFIKQFSELLSKEGEPYDKQGQQQLKPPVVSRPGASTPGQHKSPALQAARGPASTVTASPVTGSAEQAAAGPPRASVGFPGRDPSFGPSAVTESTVPGSTAVAEAVGGGSSPDVEAGQPGHGVHGRVATAPRTPDRPGVATSPMPHHMPMRPPSGTANMARRHEAAAVILETPEDGSEGSDGDQAVQPQPAAVGVGGSGDENMARQASHEGSADDRGGSSDDDGDESDVDDEHSDMSDLELERPTGAAGRGARARARARWLRADTDDDEDDDDGDDDDEDEDDEDEDMIGYLQQRSRSSSDGIGSGVHALDGHETVPQVPILATLANKQRGWLHGLVPPGPPSHEHEAGNGQEALEASLTREPSDGPVPLLSAGRPSGQAKSTTASTAVGAGLGPSRSPGLRAVHGTGSPGLRAAAGDGAATGVSAGSSTTAAVANMPEVDVYEPSLSCTRHIGRYAGHSNVQTDIKEACFWSGPRGYGSYGHPGHVAAVDRALVSGRFRGKDSLDEDRDDEDNTHGGRMEDGEGKKAYAVRDTYRVARGRLGYILAGCDTGRLWVYDRATTLPVAALGADDDVLNAVRPNPVLPIVATSGIESVVRLWAPGMFSSGGPAVDPELANTPTALAPGHSTTSTTGPAGTRATAGPRGDSDEDEGPLGRYRLGIGAERTRSPGGRGHDRGSGDPRDGRPSRLRAIDLHEPQQLLKQQDTRVRRSAAPMDDEGPLGAGGIPSELLRMILATGAVRVVRAPAAGATGAGGPPQGQAAGGAGPTEGEDEDEEAAEQAIPTCRAQ